MRILVNSILLILITLVGTGCSLFHEHDETAGWSADEFYANAKEALNDGDYEKAIRYYGKLEARYPYGRYAEQAQLETIYAHYKAGEPASAIAAAERFIKLHPRHPSADYAYYMRGLASFEPGKNFLERFFPQDPSQRDPTMARESFRHFSELVQRYPDSKYVPDAVQRMTHLRNGLARHEIMVADFYLRRGAPLAAANRAKYVLEHYARTPMVADALVIMVNAYRAMGMDNLAQDAERVLAANHPDRLGEVAPARPAATTLTDTP